ncbi:MAG: signal peptidase I [Actinomycetota bacterium]|nr:signal peptidase I [Actinomycetota bacterium]
MRRKMRVVSAALQGVVVVIALGAAAVLLLPRLLGWQVVTVMTGSMAPAYEVDAVLAIDHVDPANVRVGDVIAFEVESDRPMVTHRVVAIGSDALGLSFVTKGDANQEADIDPVPASAVRGRVVFGVPYLGMFVRVVREPVGFAVFLVLPCLLLIGQEIRTIRRDRRTKRAAMALVPAADSASDQEDFDFWTTDATEERYLEELDREVRACCTSEL